MIMYFLSAHDSACRMRTHPVAQLPKVRKTRMDDEISRRGAAPGTPAQDGVHIVGAEDFMPVAAELVSGGASVPLVVSGSSMEPFLRDGRDTVILTSPTSDAPRRGDIMLFTRQDGSYVLHRVCRVTPEALWFVGDAQSFIEGPIPRESLVAAVRTVIRRGRVIGPRSPVWIYHSARRAVKTHKMRLRAILSALVKRKEKEK